MKIALYILTAIDFFILGISASMADSKSIIPLIVCAISTFLLVPLAIIVKEFEEDEKEGKKWLK